ncbi:DUF397 domain-containing protein [Actinocorallia sp. API 0066]|uniref:DUF397 domain-containing protein n=1 Tax=Actinocorallia sp. API 0066 TaxID=2896846 RepID=UPI001E5B1CB2|nr:DUF397 domain-containing protein [Actinocorallia sp. API 0066]MCD0449373.1 DUF397 domain-containing protein [Actinocorallia sp. API 0066]
MSTMDLSSVTWRKSTYSGSTGGECVELADLAPVVAVRDSKHPDGGVLGFNRAVFRTLTREIRAGRLDL